MTAIQQLKELSIAHSRTRHPDLPDYARTSKKYTDKTANGLTNCIKDFLQFSGHQCERIACTGRYIDNSKVVRDCLGGMRKIGSGKWIRSSMQKGSADLSAVIFGRAVKIEIKQNDKQSEAQKAYQQQIERAGGVYWLVRNFDQFLSIYNQFTMNLFITTTNEEGSRNGMDKPAPEDTRELALS